MIVTANETFHQGNSICTRQELSHTKAKPGSKERLRNSTVLSPWIVQVRQQLELCMVNSANGSFIMSIVN